MKHFKFFLMSLLLFVGVGSLSATTVNYKVVYDHDLQGAGYTFKTKTLPNGSITSAEDADLLETYRNYNNPTAITSDNVNTYLQARPVTGYETTIYVASAGEIVVKYVYTGTDIITWTDGPFEYSTYFIKASCSEKKMPAGEVAVRLLMDTPQDVTDIVFYNRANNRVTNGKGDRLTTTTNEITYASDDDDDGAFGTYPEGGTATAMYKCLGQLDYGIGASLGGVSPNNIYFYERTHKVNLSTETSVTIPATVNYTDADGNVTNYKVTAIQKFGFNYKANAQIKLPYCSNPNFDNTHTETDGNKVEINHNINDHCNLYLESVDFGLNSNIETIGDYAFMSCEKLTNVTLPWKLKYLGVGAFMSAKNLANCEFQECPNEGSEFGTTRLRTIENWTFWCCTGLTTLYLADGITRVEGLASGAPLQYLVSLTNIRLPQTLVYVGPHFLCSATQLKTVTFPATLAYIDGACFHGCESLQTVYMLGAPANLVATFGSGSNLSETFGENEACCGSHVNDCTFYVPSNQLAAYKADAAWEAIDENGEWTGRSGNWTTYGNILKAIGETPIEFKAGKWSTVIFPRRVGMGTTFNCSTDDKFGSNVMVARLTEAHQDASNKSLYHLTFTEVDKTAVPTRTPLMIKPGKDVSYVMFDGGADQSQVYEDLGEMTFAADMTEEHRLNVTVPEDNTVVTMKGEYVKVELKKYDFIFQAAGSGTTASPYTYSLRKLVDGKASSNVCKCWWTFSLGGVANQNAKSNGMFFPDDFTTDIDGVEKVNFVIDAIYDLQGRRIEVKQEELPKGLFIVNGKKVLVK